MILSLDVGKHHELLLTSIFAYICYLQIKLKMQEQLRNTRLGRLNFRTMPLSRPAKYLIATHGNTKAVLFPPKAAHTAAVSRCPLHTVRASARRRTQGAYSASQAPSTQLIRLGLVERTRLFALFETIRIWRLAWLGLGGVWYGQRLGLGYAPLSHNHFAHTHTGFPVL